MRRTAHTAAVTAVILCLGTLQGLLWAEDDTGAPGPAGAGDAAARSGTEPEFKNDKAREAFAEGRKLFEEGKLKEAEKLLKTAARGAKNKEDREQVDRWVDACGAAPILAQIRALDERKYWNEAYDRLLVALPKYKGTPVEASFLSLYRELETRLFQPIETFDPPNPRRYSQQFGKTAVTDAQLLANGTACIHWQSTKDGKAGMLSVKEVTKNWSQFTTLELWVNARVPGKGEVILISTADPKASRGAVKPPGAGAGFQPVMQHPFLLPRKGGWQYLRLRLADFQGQGGADVSRVQEFRIQFAAGQPFDFFLDEIRLRRANPPQEKTPPGRRN